MKHLLAIALMVLGLSSCSMTTLEEHGVLAKASVQVAAVRLIDGDVDRAERVAEVGARVLAVLDGDLATTIAQVKTVAEKNIDWSRLSPSEAILARALIDEVAAVVAGQIDRQQLDPDVVVRLTTVIGWVVDVAELESS